MKFAVIVFPSYFPAAETVLAPVTKLKIRALVRTPLISTFLLLCILITFLEFVE
jgi:hypothetical protein